jgi:hypothetical protein
MASRRTHNSAIDDLKRRISRFRDEIPARVEKPFQRHASRGRHRPIHHQASDKILGLRTITNSLIEQYQYFNRNCMQHTKYHCSRISPEPDLASPGRRMIFDQAAEKKMQHVLPGNWSEP